MTLISQIVTTSKALQQRVVGKEISVEPALAMTRFFPANGIDHLDPFLLMDIFYAKGSSDDIEGFPSHPHRGFEMITYLLEGAMHHKDNVGFSGTIEAGGAQWMSAGKGIVHSEKPERKHNRLLGVQLWINLPAKHKMSAPQYQDFCSKDMSVEQQDNGTQIKIISGRTHQGTQGSVIKTHKPLLYLDVSLPPHQIFEQWVSDEENTVIYMIEGQAEIGDNQQLLQENTLGILAAGNLIKLRALTAKARFLVLSAKPLKEPIVRAGPFVMNTKAEIKQAFLDFRHNNF